MPRIVVFAAAVIAFMIGCGQDATEPDATSGAPSLAVGTDTVTGASITTDKDDYAPGDTVRITGAG